MPSSYTLFEVNEYIRRVIALNFTEPIWISCEISSVKEVRGNIYLDLVYHDENTQEVTAQMQANIWYKSYLFLKNKLGDLLPSILKSGSEVLVKANIEFNERYGLKLIIEDIDPSVTIGQMEMNKQKIIQRLNDDGLIDKNKDRELPTVIKRIAVISSDNAAGYIDFYKHLMQNNFGYTFEIDLYTIPLQGQNTAPATVAAFEKIEKTPSKYDVVLIIRGGGSKLDLAAFDHYNIGAAIARSKYPVITGIGHDIDSTIADVCAYLSCKTPTAVADHILDHNFKFESELMEMVYWIGQTAKQRHRRAELEMQQLTQMLRILPSEIIRTKRSQIERADENIRTACNVKINNAYDFLDFAEKQIKVLDPKNTLMRGYTIYWQGDKIVTRGKDVKKGASAKIEFFDKTIVLNHE
jgi:exodeoxyribonuclease VII large subunit